MSNYWQQFLVTSMWLQSLIPLSLNLTLSDLVYPVCDSSEILTL